MKIFLLLCLASSLSSAFNIPKGSFNLGQLEEAQKKAAAINQPLAFVIVEKKVTPT